MTVADVAFDFKTEMIAVLPHLRAFARGLCADSQRADDLVQEALLRAWANRSSFTPGTNMRAWLFKILRNVFYTDLRGRKDHCSTNDTPEPQIPAPQFDRVMMDDLRRALAQLPAQQREAIILVGAGGYSYEEAAEICNCALGTIKSRVARARKALVAHFGSEDLPLSEEPRVADGAQGVRSLHHHMQHPGE